MARHLGVSRQSLYNWQGRVPAEYVPRIAELSGLPRHELRPDIFEANEGRAA